MKGIAESVILMVLIGVLGQVVCTLCGHAQESKTSFPSELPTIAASRPRLVFRPDQLDEQRMNYLKNPFFAELSSVTRPRILAPYTSGSDLNKSIALKDAAFIAQVSREQGMVDASVKRLGEFVADILDGGVRVADDQAHSMILTNLGFAYDWLYPFLADEVRKDGAEALAQLIDYGVKEFAFNYNPLYAAFNNHAIQGWSAVGVAGLAIAGEHPDGLKWAQKTYEEYTRIIFPAYDLVIGCEGIWNEGTHYNQVMMKAVFYFMDAVESATGLDVYDQDWVGTFPYYWVYLTRPDESMLISGNWFAAKDYETKRNLLARVFWPVANVAARKQDPYLQRYANYAAKWIGNDRVEAWNVIWYNPKLPERPLSELPHDRYFHSKTPIGPSESLVVFRTGWDENAVIVTVDGSDWFSHHDHYDAASFTIFYRADLAIDPGYTDNELDSWRFFRRTAAHNSLIVDAPEVASEWANHNWGYDGGGQRLPITVNRPRSVEQYFSWKHPDYPNTSLFEMANVTDYESDGNLGYVCVDATLAYRASQLTRFMRHVAFLKPDILVVYDVVDTPAGREPQWLLQTATEPRVYDGGFVVTNGGGELHVKTVLPTVRSVAVQESPAAYRLPPGHRIDVKSMQGETITADQVRHRFLHVFSIGDAGETPEPDVSWRVDGDQLVLTLTRQEKSTTLRLAWDGSPGLK